MREMAQSRSGHASEPYAAQLGDREFVGLDASWPDDDVETILQANLFHVVEPEDEAGARWLIQLTGAVGGPTAEQDYDLVREVILTTRVTPWRAEQPEDVTRSEVGARSEDGDRP
jgi:hypothetical protein